MQMLGVVPSAVLLAAGPALTFVCSSAKAIYDPTNGEAVGTVGEVSALTALENVRRAMMADITGRTILTHRPRVTDSVLEAARKMDENSFGRRYAAYMDHNKFLPSGRTPVQHIADPTLSYIMTRYRECHDFLHTITDCGRTVEEEVAVKLLEFQHTGLPLGLLAVLGGAPHMSAAQRQQVREYWRWAQANRPNGTHGERFINCYLNIMWEDLLPRPHAEVVREVGITPLKEFLK